jgi:cytochrome P450
MGRDFRTIQNTENKVADSFMAILEPTKEKMAFLAVNFILPQWFAKRLPWRLNKVVDDEVGYLRSICKEIVHEKRIAMTATKATATELEADILGSMLLGGDFTDDELVDQMLTFLAAGVRTRPVIFHSHVLTRTARNDCQCSHLDLLPPDSASRCPRASSR